MPISPAPGSSSCCLACASAEVLSWEVDNVANRLRANHGSGKRMVPGGGRTPMTRAAKLGFHVVEAAA
jgi:hypothetical protein